ncbi:MAG TPA: efflux RND transporter periplasmic adaptor subunit [Thermoanaerobaculia bacterium]|nr:efflux RND transporter periplasmic adaptor subunit [Thermoanaerobaculia bacterium]
MAETTLRVRLRAAITLTIAALFLIGGWTLRNKLAADRRGEWVPARRGDLVNGVQVNGTLAAVDSDSIGPPQINDTWQFKIRMMAPEGSDVKKGAPVLGFDTTDLEKRLEEKSAEGEQARKEIEKKRADLILRREDEKLKLAEAEARLRKSGLKLQAPPVLSGVKERKEIELEYALAKYETEAVRARLEALEHAAAAEIRLLESKQQAAAAIVRQAQDAIARMTVVASRSGTIIYATSSSRSGGEKKKVGDSCWRSERVIEIPDLMRMKAKGDVDEVDAGRVAVGQRVTFRLDAHPDEEFAGTIVSAARTVQQQPLTRDPLKVLHVEIRIDRTDPAKMRPGMRFQGTVELGRTRNALLIPRKAVFLSARGPIAWRRGLVSVEERPLRLGQLNATSVEVLGGLSPGDRVLVARDGSQDVPKT